MIEVSIKEETIFFEVKGWDKLWAFKGHLEIPISHITGASTDTEIAKGWWHGFRAPGTQVPGIITAGTFYQDGKRVFWDVHNPENTIVIELDHEHYDKLVIEVEDPITIVNLIKSAITSNSSK